MKTKKQKNDVEYLLDDEHLNLSDFCVASALEFYGNKYVAINRDPKFYGQRVEFVYRKTEEVEKIIEAFWRGELLVDPKKFWDIVRALKARARIY